MADHPLEPLVADLRYKRDWSFHLTGMLASVTPYKREPSHLVITCRVEDSRIGLDRTVEHWMPIPPAAVWAADDAYWRRWLLKQIIKVETHEACEFFQLGDERPFFPDHASSPYAIRDRLALGPSSDPSKTKNGQ